MSYFYSALNYIIVKPFRVGFFRKYTGLWCSFQYAHLYRRLRIFSGFFFILHFMKPDSFVTPFPGHLIRQHNLPSGLMFHQFFHQFYMDLFNIFFASCRFAQQFMDQKRPDSLIYTSETLFQDHYSICFILFGFYAVFSAFFHFLFHKCPHCPHLLHRIRHM